jgi:hypothetical protein
MGPDLMYDHHDGGKSYTIERIYETRMMRLKTVIMRMAWLEQRELAYMGVPSRFLWRLARNSLSDELRENILFLDFVHRVWVYHTYKCS